MANETHSDPDGAIGLLRLRGADVIKFLQGQLSNDMTTLSAERITLAGLHNPQGRVLALLRLAALEPDHVIALLPAELAEATRTTLQRYVLRAKVVISNASSAAEIAMLAAQLPAAAPVLSRDAHALNIAAGVAQVYAATSGTFVAQMLNLDCIEAISFSKGCYTGQEIIARAHYRGRMKRRMQRFASASAIRLAPGQAVALSDGRAAQIVDAVARADGRCEFLAVAPLSAESTAAAASAVSTTFGPAGTPVACTPLPLPYVLPE
jgi:tRNA-modifying protein YgfZ